MAERTTGKMEEEKRERATGGRRSGSHGSSRRFEPGVKWLFGSHDRGFAGLVLWRRKEGSRCKVHWPDSCSIAAIRPRLTPLSWNPR